MGYEKIENFYRNNDMLMWKECYSLEKIEGTTAWIQWSNGHISFHSGGANREQFIQLFNEEKLTELFKSFEYPEDMMVRIHGEAYGGKIQAMSKTYGKDLHFIGFEVRVGNNWLDVPRAEDYCTRFGIEFVPYEKIPATIEAINAERDRDSVVAVRRGMGEGHKREGVILRPLVEVKLNSGARMIAKHKRDDFRETKTPRDPTISPDKLKLLEDAEAIADEWCVPNRLKHVLNKIFLNGTEPELKDIPIIIKNMIEDIYVEGKGEIVEGREVQKAIGNKTVQLFKHYLQKKIFGGSNE